ncbi:ubiquitin-related domain-containing protein [Pilobolus umbonatus]|nr:ubiquitin-related domain-containing protein [Pilobolus umbonatus]
MATDIDTLISMGFSPIKVQKAWKATKGAGLQPAMDWLLSHPEVTDEVETEPEPTPEEDEIQDGEQTAQSLICNDCQKLFRDANGAERHATRTGHQNFAESTEAIQPLTEAEKQQKLAELKSHMAQKRLERERQEKEERVQAEKIRRKAGQDLTEIKEALERKEMQKLMEAKRREKEADKKAKAKIKAQIEQDKKDRAAKKAAHKMAVDQQAEADAKEALASAGIKKEYSEARIQVRVPGGAPITHTFSATCPLSDVYDFLQSQGQPGPFHLSTTFPRKTFNEEDKSKSLKELNLVPSAALVLNH